MHDWPQNRLPNVGAMQNEAHKLVAALSYPSFPAYFPASTKMRHVRISVAPHKHACQQGSLDLRTHKWGSSATWIQTKRFLQACAVLGGPKDAEVKVGRVFQFQDLLSTSKHPTLWIQGKALLIGSHGFGELAENTTNRTSFGRFEGTTFQVSNDVYKVCKNEKNKRRIPAHLENSHVLNKSQYHKWSYINECHVTQIVTTSPQPWGYRASEAIAWSCPRRAHACRWAAA